jgi:quercetin dioxygenase-like cupin family protein
MGATELARHRTTGEGEAFWAMGSLFEMKLQSGETGGSFGMAEVTQPPGVATPLHVHTCEAEVFYVLEGMLSYEAGGELHKLAAGSTMYLPMGVPHRFRITGDSPARILAMVLPGGLLDLYGQVGVPAASRSIPTSPDPQEFARWGTAAPEFGLEVLGPPLEP